jgi:hypothetical protein
MPEWERPSFIKEAAWITDASRFTPITHFKVQRRFQIHIRYLILSVRKRLKSRTNEKMTIKWKCHSGKERTLNMGNRLFSHQRFIGLHMIKNRNRYTPASLSRDAPVWSANSHWCDSFLSLHKKNSLGVKGNKNARKITDTEGYFVFKVRVIQKLRSLPDPNKGLHAQRIFIWRYWDLPKNQQTGFLEKVQ